ncbi:hypothetical protein [Oceanobacillus luteolus]|uniref:ParA family protein n=1 Tax=Oceanobacillus luteolus TaxID=1274358 RepID=A0ABW4HVW3_9BACI
MISVVSSDDLLIKSIQKHLPDNEVVRAKTIESVNHQNTKTLVVTDEFLHHNDFIDYDFSMYEYVFYVMQNEVIDVLESSIKGLCDGYNIHYISSRFTNEQVAEQIKHAITPSEKKKKNIFSFFSTVSNVGSTSTTFSTAFSVSENTDAKVAVLILNAWDSGADYIDYKATYLDQVKDSILSSRYDDNEEFESLFQEVKKDSLYVMLGNRNTKLERLYTKEEIERVITRAEEVFDIVIIDGGCHYDNANIIQTLYSSDYHFLVLNQQEKLKRKWEEVYQNILQPLGFQKEQFLLVLNRFHNNPNMPTIKDLRNQYGMNVLTAIEESPNGYLSEFNKKSLYQFDDMPYREAVNVIGRTIAASAGFEFKDGSRRRKFFSL